MREDILSVLNEFYHSYIVDTYNGAFQVFKSFTYGEMVISFLLFMIMLIILLKWFYEVLR